MTNHRVLVGASAGTHAVACMVDAWHREAPAFGHIGRKVPVIAAALMVAFAAPPQTFLALGALEGKLRIALICSGASKHLAEATSDRDSKRRKQGLTAHVQYNMIRRDPFIQDPDVVRCGELPPKLMRRVRGKSE